MSYQFLLINIYVKCICKLCYIYNFPNLCIKKKSNIKNINYNTKNLESKYNLYAYIYKHSEEFISSFKN